MTSVPHDPSGEDDETQALRPLDEAGLPIFLDVSGRRRRWLKAGLWTVSIACLAYATLLVLSMLTGRDGGALFDPRFRPAERRALPVASGSATVDAEHTSPGDPPERAPERDAVRRRPMPSTPTATPAPRPTPAPSASSGQSRPPSANATPTPSRSGPLQDFLASLNPWP